MDLLEIETIKKAKQGEQEALLCLYEKYLPLFKKLCRNRADYSNVLEVDDLLQESFLVQKFLNKWTIFLFCSILFSSNQKEH